MRRVRYVVATSLDGYIAGPNGEADWIIMDPDIDFGELFAEFDTLLMGRRTFEGMEASGAGMIPGMEAFVFSRTLPRNARSGVSVVAEGADKTVAELRTSEGKDIWLFGGGLLFHSLAEAGLVDTVEVAGIPILLGGGVPLLPTPANRISLQLEGEKVYKTGIVSLRYAIQDLPEASSSNPS